MEIKRGQIYYADLSPVVGSEQGGYRPVLIIQNNKGNKYSPCVIVAIITSAYHNKAKMPTHVCIEPTAQNGLTAPSRIELEQIRTIDKTRLKKQIGFLSPLLMRSVDICIKISLGLLESHNGDRF